MANSENGLKRNGRFSYQQTIILAIVSAVLSGSGVPYLLSALGINPYRMDAFTGTDGKALAQRIDKLEAHVENHPDVELRASIADLRVEIAAAKAQRELMLINQQQILSRINR